MGDQTAQFTEEYCTEKMKIIALIIALLVAVAASSEISGDSNERVVPEESLVSEGYHFNPGNYGNTVAKGYFAHPPLLGHHKIVKKHVKSVKNLFSKVKGLAKKGKKGAIKKLIKKHVRKLKRRVKKHVKWHFRRGRSSRRSRRSSRRSRRSSRRSGRSIRQRGTKWECSWNHNPWFPCTPRPGDVVVPPYNGYWTRHGEVATSDELIAFGSLKKHMKKAKNHAAALLKKHMEKAKKHMKKHIKKHSKLVKKHIKDVKKLF